MASSSQSTYLNNQCPDLIRYNQSFYSSVCHVCKKKVCGSSNIICQCECRMIYYCCMEHKLEDYIHHASFCRVIQSIYAQVEFRHFRAPTFSHVNWINSRNTLINLIEHKLARPLYLHEKQMIMFVRSCLVCRAQENLLFCDTCYCVDYCLQHQIQATEIHRTSCFNLLECFYFDIQTSRSIFTIKFTKFSNESKLLENMDKFIDQYIHDPNLLMKTFYSDYVSAPLTLCYWIQKFHLLKPESIAGPNFVVHIIDANVLNREYVEAWHLLLHYLPRVKNLRLELIGSATSYDSDTISLCHFCIKRLQKLSYGCYQESYYQYVSSKKYKKPNVIMGFESNLTTWNTESITALKRNIQCPIIISGESKDKLDEYIFYMNFPEEDAAFSYTLDEANPFQSYKPYRKIESDGVFYRNKFVIVFKMKT